jgi:hypothetical protein
MMAERLYGATEIGTILGLSRDWVLKHVRRGDGPPAEYEAMKGKQCQALWSAASLSHWRAYHASGESLPRTNRYSNCSDHYAVNQMGPLAITWKLWWRNTHDGGTSWWFSTPQGWWFSEDDGVTWKPTESMVRPSAYHYYSVNGSVRPKGAVAGVLREAEKLRRWIEN